MPENQQGSSPKRISYIGLGTALGLIFGGILGLIAGNMIVFAGGGMVLGLAIGSAADRGRGPR